MVRECGRTNNLIPSTRLRSYRLSTSGQNVGEKMNKEHWIKKQLREDSEFRLDRLDKPKI